MTLRPTYEHPRAKEYRAPGGAWDVPSFDELLTTRAIPDAVAVVQGDVRLTGAELEARVGALAGGLRKLGVRRRDVVAWQLPNWWETVVLYRACWRLGAIGAAVHHLAGPAEAAIMLDAVQPKVVLGATGGAVAERPGSITVRGDHDGFSAMLDAEPVTESAAKPSDLAVALFTSGSTGVPKAALHTQRGLSYKTIVMTEAHSLTPADSVLMPAPLAHISGMLNAVQIPGYVPMKSVLMERFDPELAIDLVEQEAITFMIGPPTFFVRLMASPSFSTERMMTLRLVSSGGAGVTPAFVASASERLGARVKRTYGSTEAPTVTTSVASDSDEQAREHDGRATGVAELRVADPVTLREVASGDTGELWLRGPELFAGYAEAEATKASTHRGWFRTGDLATVDAEGWLTIVGRMKDVIIRGGENIAAAEVENALEAHPDVRQAVAVGFPDPVMGERVCAYVVAEPTFDLEVCRAWFAERGVARFKTPERVVVLDDLPVLAAGKPDRAALRLRAAEAAKPSRTMRPMPDPATVLTERLEAAITEAFGSDLAGTDPVLRRSDHADFQANVAMALGKRLGHKPRDIADQIVEHLDASDIVEAPVIAGPGFINLQFRTDFLGHALEEEAADPRLGVPLVTNGDPTMVEYSAPNVAKEMHVGHLRSSVIGDALARTLSFAGYPVVRQNHLGDWGTQFGMLIEHLVDLGWAEPGHDHTIADLNALYQAAQTKFAADDDFKTRARERVVRLQSGDDTTLALWQELTDESKRHFERVYAKLGVLLRAEDIRGESFYNDELAATVTELEAKGLVTVNEGALCAFPPGFTNRDGDPLPLIVRKSDGGYGYASTDLAAIRFRTQALGLVRLVYVVDARQSQHFAMVFATAQQAGWLVDATAEHVAFGTVLGSDGKPFKTRSGESVKLIDLLDEGIERAAAFVADKGPDLDVETRAAVARAVGIGAIKYADLASDRVKDYVFDWDRLLAMDGNTAPYLQYAHARIRSILRRATAEGFAPGPIHIEAPQERALALALVAFPETVAQVVDTLQPHRLCTYLFDLASTFSGFYEHCPVLRADTDRQRASRIALAQLTARVIAQGLDLLGIQAPEQM